MAKHKTIVGKLLSPLTDLIANILHNANHTFLQVAISVTEKVKEVLSSGKIDVLTDLIPTDIDDKIVELLRVQLPKILASELLLSNLSSTSTEAEVQDTAKKILDGFGGLPDDRKEEFYTSVAAKIYIVLQDGKVSFGEAAMLAEASYQLWLKSKQP